MYNKILFSLLLFPISLVSMDVEPLSDSTFLLWCGALACKEIKREQVINQTPRQFLGIDETGIPTTLFKRTPKISDDQIDKRETVFVEDGTGMHDRRLGGRWRLLEIANANNTTNYQGLDWYGRYHSVPLVSRSCCYEESCDEDDNKEEMLLYANSIPYADEFYLYAGTSAHKDENLWVTANPVKMTSAYSDKEYFPLRLLWVEKFKKPVWLHEFMIPAKTYDVVQNSVAIKFTEDGTQFQVYYDASEKRTESVIAGTWKSKNAIVTVENYVEHRDPPSLWVLTYTLNRMKKYGTKMDSASLARWYDVFQRMQRDSLKENELTNTKTEINKALDQKI